MALSILPITPQEISIDKAFAPNFLTTVGQQIANPPSYVLSNYIIKPFINDSFYASLIDNREISTDGDIVVEGEFQAKSEVAVVSFMLSTYYKDYRQRVSTATKFKLNVSTTGPDATHRTPIEFYCLKNYSLKPTDIVIISDQDMIHASILGLNMSVKSMREKSMAGMHPLSRTSVSEEGLSAFSEFLSKDVRMKQYLTELSPLNTAVKLFNTACTRKSHQFYGDTRFYCPELAAAALISGVMNTQKVSRGLIDITNSALKKIARTAGTLDQDLVITLMDFTIAGGTALDAQAIFDAFKAKKNQGFYIPKQAPPTELQSFRAAGQQK